VRGLSLDRDTVVLSRLEVSRKSKARVENIYISLVEDIVILLPGVASWKCKAPTGEGLVSCQRYCSATTGWKSVEKARLVSKICISLVEIL
jgi:hypothetical protein